VTAIVPQHIKTKKALKTAFADHDTLEITDPKPWGEDIFVFNVPTPEGLKHYKYPAGSTKHEVMESTIVYCTNHPKRSWFAQIIVAAGGKVIVK
jgi:hypothetical protein